MKKKEIYTISNTCNMLVRWKQPGKEWLLFRQLSTQCCKQLHVTVTLTLINKMFFVLKTWKSKKKKEKKNEFYKMLTRINHWFYCAMPECLYIVSMYDIRYTKPIIRT